MHCVGPVGELNGKIIKMKRKRKRKRKRKGTNISLFDKKFTNPLDHPIAVIKKICILDSLVK